MARQDNLPSTQTAIVAGPTGEFIISHNVPVIELEPDAVIIKTAAVALNPADTKMVGDFVVPGAIFGFDCAGTIVAVGSAVKKDLVVGDRVCGSADGMSRLRPLGGGFAQYASLPGDMALKIPDNVTFEAAAAYGTALASAGMALFYSLKIPAKLLEEPAKVPFPVLVYGGSTSTGTMAIQLLKAYASASTVYRRIDELMQCRCGLTPITTCSPKNFAFVKSFGAEEAFDYNSPTCAQDIKAYCKNKLAYALDCITQQQTMKICYAAIGRVGGRYTALDPYPENQATRKVVKPDWILATRITGKGCTWPEPYGSAPDKELREFAHPFFGVMQKLLDEGKIRPHPARPSKGGFEALIEGVGIIRRGEISGEKLVYRLS